MKLELENVQVRDYILRLWALTALCVCGAFAHLLCTEPQRAVHESI